MTPNENVYCTRISISFLLHSLVVENENPFADGTNLAITASSLNHLCILSHTGPKFNRGFTSKKRQLIDAKNESNIFVSAWKINVCLIGSSWIGFLTKVTVLKKADMSFHNSLTDSSAHVHWILVRNYETSVMKNQNICRFLIVILKFPI